MLSVVLACCFLFVNIVRSGVGGVVGCTGVVGAGEVGVAVVGTVVGAIVITVGLVVGLLVGVLVRRRQYCRKLV